MVHLKRLQRNGLFEVISEDDLVILKKLLSNNINAQHYTCCFCDKRNNLYSVDIEIIRGNYTVYFLKSNVKTVFSGRPLGYYEPQYIVYESLTELFHHFPKTGKERRQEYGSVLEMH